ncbi:MAG TPA: cupin-like domain-containing protein [Polyangiaceae bacterium]|nr:cupin-like domain-containing protein [Polyangiaceae bacterium]
MPEIERVRGIELQEFKERFELPELPVVIEGGCAHYRAVQSWTPAYLKEKLGHEEIQYKLSTTHQHPNFHAKTVPEMFARGSSTLAKFLDAVTSGEPSERSHRYFTGDERFLLKRRDGQDTRDEALAPLLDDVEVPAFLPKDRLYTVWGWLSGRGVRTWLHYETNGCHNFNAQLAGEKTCVLYAPEHLPKMRMFKPGAGNPAYNCSEIDVEEAAEQAGLAAAHGLTATLKAGDLLLIPAWWFHTFFHLGEFNANINFWWKPERPTLNQVAVRQGFLDAMLATGYSEKSASPAQAELLARVEQAIVTRG